MVALAVALLAALALSSCVDVPGPTPATPALVEDVDQRLPEPTEWDEHEAPDYYRVVGTTEGAFTLDSARVKYGTPDALGRTTGAEALIDAQMMAEGTARPRQSLEGEDPSGWGHNEEVDVEVSPGTWYHGYFWNRSHLIAKSLGGDDQAHNLITGTRMQNVGANDGTGGMAYCENLCRDWLSEHPDGTMSYRVTPVYRSDELVCRSVFVDMRSSDGAIDRCVEVYNVARGYAIDYATGSFSQTHDADTPSASEEPGEDDGTVPDAVADDDPNRIVVVSGSGKAYHHDRSCKGLSEANPNNLSETTLAEAIDMGRKPCGICGG